MVTGQITEQEYLAAYRLHRRKTVSLIKWCAGIAFVAGAFLFAVFADKSGFLLMCAALGALLGELIQSRLFLQPRLRRLYSQVRGRVDLNYAWDDEKLFLSSVHGQASRPWTDFLKARESDELLLLYFNDAVFEIIAKRWFHHADDLHAFKSHLKLIS